MCKKFESSIRYLGRDTTSTNMTLGTSTRLTACKFMSECSRKRAATSPLNPEFDKKSRLGLRDGGLHELNENLRDWMLDLAQTFREVAVNVLVLTKGRPLAIDNSWTKVK